MNPEVMQSIVAGAKLLVVAFIGFWYSLCGRGVIKGWIGRRRVFLPLVLITSWIISMICLGKFSWVLLSAILISYGVYYGMMSIGYGTDSWLRKIFGKTAQQFIVGGLQGGACILVGIVSGLYWMVVLSVVIGSCSLGILGSVGDGETPAANKEAIVGASLFLIPMYLI